MWTNATITIKRRGTTYDQTTGDRTAGTQALVLKNAACVFSQIRQSGRSRFQEGVREYSETVPGVLIPDQNSTIIKIGDEATVKCEGITGTYTVNHTVLSSGLTESHWELELEATKAGQV